jgi:hypothetical protein
MLDMNKAVKTWERASNLQSAEHSLKRSHKDRVAIREQRKELYQQAENLAGGYWKLMKELTERQLISWAQGF